MFNVTELYKDPIKKVRLVGLFIRLETKTTNTFKFNVTELYTVPVKKVPGLFHVIQPESILL